MTLRISPPASAISSTQPNAKPALFIDSMEDVDFGKPSFTTRGDTLTATVPVTDSWGEAAPDLSGKTLSLVLADSGQAQDYR